ATKLANEGSFEMAFLQAAPPQGNWTQSLIMLLVLFGLFYVMLIRPQQQHARKRREILSNLKRGDRVSTIGCIHGVIEAIEDDSMQLRIAENVVIRLNRAGVGQVKSEQDA